MGHYETVRRVRQDWATRKADACAVYHMPMWAVTDPSAITTDHCRHAAAHTHLPGDVRDVTRAVRLGMRLEPTPIVQPIHGDSAKNNVLDAPRTDRAYRSAVAQLELAVLDQDVPRARAIGRPGLHLRGAHVQRRVRSR